MPAIPLRILPQSGQPAATNRARERPAPSSAASSKTRARPVGIVPVDARIRAARGSHADPRLRADARDRDGGVREELAAGVWLFRKTPCDFLITSIDLGCL